MRGVDVKPLADPPCATKIKVMWVNPDGTLAWDMQPSNMVVPDADLDLAPSLASHMSSEYTFIFPTEAPLCIFAKVPPTPKKRPEAMPGPSKQEPPDVSRLCTPAEEGMAGAMSTKEDKKTTKKTKKKKEELCEVCWQPYYRWKGKLTHGSTQMDALCTLTGTGSD
jgi:hypothetical protein